MMGVKFESAVRFFYTFCVKMFVNFRMFCTLGILLICIIMGTCALHVFL